MRDKDYEYQIKLVFKNYCGEVIESHLMAKAYCENVANKIKDMLSAMDDGKGFNYIIVKMPRR